MAVDKVLMAVAGILSLVGSLRYIAAVLRGSVHPKWATWLIWGLLDCVILAGMWLGGKETNWQIILCTIFAWVIFLLACRYGVPGWNRIDQICLVGALISIGLLVPYPQLALGLSLLATGIGAIPTVASAWEDPAREDAIAWACGTLSSVVILIALGVWTFASAAQPITFLVVNGGIWTIVALRRR